MRALITQLLSDYITECPIVLQTPKESSHGHFATPIFALAKIRSMPPQELAKELATKLSNEPIFAKVEAVGGFINMTLSTQFLSETAKNVLYGGFNSLIDSDMFNEKILLEFVSANPTGPLHIGHARGAIYGDALLKAGRFLGYDITSEYYINDAGRQVYLLGLSIFLRGREQLGLDVIMPEEYYRGDYINDLATEALKIFSSSYFESEKHIVPLSDWAKEKMMNRIRENLSGCGITFDNYVSEKEIFKTWDETRKVLENSLYLHDDKVWLKTSDKGDEKDRVVVRENGEPTYLAGDITYHRHKYLRPYDKYINIWGADHHGYIARVKASVDYLGYDSNKLEVLLSQMVALLKGGEPYKMSKRAGNFILMEEIVEEVGADALRFIFLTKKADTHLEFDIDILNNQDSSNPVYYVNYAHARVHSVAEKSSLKKEECYESHLDNLNDEILSLVFWALTLPQVVEDAFNKRDMQLLTEYLIKTATRFHKFYNENRIIGNDNEKSLLKVAFICAESLRQGLEILGITAKERM